MGVSSDDTKLVHGAGARVAQTKNMGGGVLSNLRLQGSHAVVSRSIRVLLVQFQPEQEIAERFAVRIQIERGVDAAFERVLHDEGEAVEVRELVARDLAADEVRKSPLDALGRQRLFEKFEILRLVGPHIDVRGIAFVAGARMRDVADDPAFVASRGVHATTIVMVGLTRSRSIKTDFVITQGAIAPR